MFCNTSKPNNGKQFFVGRVEINRLVTVFLIYVLGIINQISTQYGYVVNKNIENLKYIR